MIVSVAAKGLSVIFGDVPEWFLKTPVRCFFAAALSFLLVYTVGPCFIRKLTEMKAGQPIREDEGFLLAELHKKKKNTPTMGGALIIAAVVIAVLFFGNWSSVFVPLLMGSLIIFGLLGGVDDWRKLKSRSPKGLSGRIRLLVQSLWAFFIIWLLSSPENIKAFGLVPPQILQNGCTVDWSLWKGSMMLPFMTHPIVIASGALWLLIFALEWLTIVGAANAVNLTDGLDGLAAGCSALVAATIGGAALFFGNEVLANGCRAVYVESSGEIAVCLFALVGACVGFLWFNSFPAEVFMGDTGSLAIGGMLGVSAVLLQREWLLGLVGAVFVIETLSVMVQVISFKRTGRRVFLCAPLHHHFEYTGLHEAKVVFRFWVVQLLLAIVGIFSLVVWYYV